MIIRFSTTSTVFLLLTYALCHSVLILFYLNGMKTPFHLFLANLTTNFNNSKYLIESPKCKILNIDSYDLAENYTIKNRYISCNNGTILTYLKKNGNISTLCIDWKNISNKKKLRCCHSKISRSSYDSDNRVEFSKCEWFKNNVTISDDAIYVFCLEKIGNYKRIYKNTHAQVTLKRDVLKKFDLVKNKTAFSVLILGIDSVSRLSFIRNLPKTYQFLKDNEWISFKGYNKIAENTYPNIMAFLTGYGERDSRIFCAPDKVAGLDKCPFIWNDYRDLGYATAYVEDATYFSTFNNYKKGFKNPPTDYYFRPYMMASENNLDIVTYSGLRYCTGPESAGERVLKLAQDFTTTFINYPTFGLFWMNSFSHNDPDMVAIMDDRINFFLQDLVTNRVLDNTIVMFLSDHGVRFGEFRQTPMGWYEDKLPFFFLWVPFNFRVKYPREFHNIKKNANYRLTTPFDLYMTLQHIFLLSEIKYTVVPSSGCSKSKSLFTEIERDRSCKDAGIALEWCACTQYNPVDQNSTIVKDALDYVIEHIRNEIQLMEENNRCANFSLDRVISARIANDPCFQNENRVVLIVFETYPEAIFEAVVTYKKCSFSRVCCKVSRIDEYGPHSECVSNEELKKLCYCF